MYVGHGSTTKGARPRLPSVLLGMREEGAQAACLVLHPSARIEKRARRPVARKNRQEAAPDARASGTGKEALNRACLLYGASKCTPKADPRVFQKVRWREATLATGAPAVCIRKDCRERKLSRGRRGLVDIATRAPAERTGARRAQAGGRKGSGGPMRRGHSSQAQGRCGANLSQCCGAPTNIGRLAGRDDVEARERVQRAMRVAAATGRAGLEKGADGVENRRSP